MTNSAIVPIAPTQEAPEPMSPLVSEKIHPDNISREQAVMRAMGLDKKQERQLKQQRAKVAKTLDRAQYPLLLARYKELAEQLKLFGDEYRRLKTEQPEGWQESLVGLRMDNQRARDEQAALHTRIKPLWTQAQLLTKLDELISVFVEAQERKKDQAAQYKLIENEALIWYSIIRSCWAKLKDCHHKRSREGKVIYDLPEVERIVITPNVIYFKVLTLTKTVTGYKVPLPYNVYIDALLSPEVTSYIANVSGRQIAALSPKQKDGTRGVWYALNRTDTPNGILDFVSYSEVMHWYPDDFKYKVIIPVGVGEQNKIKWVNFTDFPHWMVVGQTGTGKSNFINVMFSSLISQYKPADVRIVAVDLKGGVELSIYQDVPHLLGSVVQSVDVFAERLAQLEAEMSERFAALKEAGARDLPTYNQRSSFPMARIIVIIDEFSSVESQGELTKSIHNSMMQLTSKGRAVGINIVICTQSPRVDIVPGKIKDNCSVKIVGRAGDTQHSRIMIGTGAAAHIAEVPGRMLAKIDQTPIEVQTPRIVEDEIKEAIAIAIGVGDAPAIQLPEALKSEERWTTQAIIGLCIDHLGGHVSADKLYIHLKNDNITNGQIRKLVKVIYDLEYIEHEGVEYKVKRIKNQRYLVAAGDESEAA
jgi:hypothetical protein